MRRIEGRLKSIILLNFLIIFTEVLYKFSYYSQNYSHFLNIIHTKVALLLQSMHACLLIKHQQLYLVTSNYFIRHRKLSKANDSFNCCHRYETRVSEGTQYWGVEGMLVGIMKLKNLTFAKGKVKLGV